MFRPFLGLIVVVALLVSVSGGGAGVAAAEEPQVCHVAGSPAPKAVKVRTYEGTVPISGSLAQLPGAEVSFTVPSGTDAALVTFSAGCRLKNASSGPSGADDYVGVQVMLGTATAVGEPMRPIGVPLTPFCSDDSWAAYSVTYCGRVGPGTPWVRVYAYVIDGEGANTLQGELLNWTLQVQVLE